MKVAIVAILIVIIFGLIKTLKERYQPLSGVRSKRLATLPENVQSRLVSYLPLAQRLALRKRQALAEAGLIPEIIGVVSQYNPYAPTAGYSLPEGIYDEAGNYVSSDMEDNDFSSGWGGGFEFGN